MNWIEIIQLKSYTSPDKDSAIQAFQQLTAPAWDPDLKEINLFKSQNLENELSILINWSGEAPSKGKSRLGLQLARAFAEFGHIYHSCWRHKDRLVPAV